MTFTHKLLYAFVVCLVSAPLGALALDSLGGHCSHCGCCCECQKVCRMICETKEVKKITYSCKCEDFCVPGPSQKCDTGCCNCGHCKDCRERMYIPTAAYIKTRKVPVKHEEVVKKPTYRFVVEYLCPTCAGKCAK